MASQLLLSPSLGLSANSSRTFRVCFLSIGSLGKRGIAHEPFVQCVHLFSSRMNAGTFLESGEKLGYKVVDLVTGDEAVMAHKTYDSRLRVLGFGIDTEALESVALPAIERAKEEAEVIVIDEIGKFAVESEAFVNAVRGVLEIDKPTILTLHKKSRHPLLQDIRRRDDGRILEVTPVNRALLPYKVHKLMRETY